MVGLEIAGLVLGALPILISALEHYEDILAPALAFVRWRGHLSALVRELFTLKALYDITIRGLLGNIATTEDLDQMMDDGANELWREPGIERSLKQKLGSVYEPCILVMEDIMEILGEVAKHLEHLGIKSAEKLVWDEMRNLILANAESLESQGRPRLDLRKRINFTMKRRRTKEIVGKLDIYIERLYRFTDRVDKLRDETYESRPKTKFSAPLDMIRENAAKVHRALFQSWCNAAPSHCAGLLLEQRLVRKKPKKVAQCTRLEERVAEPDCFVFCLRKCQSEYHWANTELRLSKPSEASGIARRVQFFPEPSQDVPRSDLTLLQEITELCPYIHEPGHPCVGLCLCHSGVLRGYVANRPEMSFAAQRITLDKLLPMISRSELNLPYIEVYSMTIALVASIFQLSRTPWLDKKLSKADILFLEASCNRGHVPVDVQHPYLLHSFPSSAVLSRTPPQRSSSLDRLNLLALARILLEISLAQVGRLDQVNEIGLSSNESLTDPMMDLPRISGWLCENHHTLSRGFGDAINCCTKACIDKDANFGDVQFCKYLEEGILLPLEKDLQSLVFGT